MAKDGGTGFEHSDGVLAFTRGASSSMLVIILIRGMGFGFQPSMIDVRVAQEVLQHSRSSEDFLSMVMFVRRTTGALPRLCQYLFKQNLSLTFRVPKDVGQA